jgi:Zn-dependent M28 family amino/carboxypeptidase
MTSLITVGIALIALLLASGYFMSRMPGQSLRGPLAPLNDEDHFLIDRLRNHVAVLAGMIGERHLAQFDRLQAAAAQIESTFQEIGLQPRRVSYTLSGRTVDNIEVVIPGVAGTSDCFLVGAHYDTVSGTPGANDNASGVAALLELARAFSGSRPQTTLRLVAFVNEEPPYFKTDRMGSLVYARQLKTEKVVVTGMLSLETIGYYTSQAKSQRFPLPLLHLFYPDRGDFIAFVGNPRSRTLLRESLRVFRDAGVFPSEGLIAPSALTGVDWSDHWSFWHEGWPAVMVTDTALFRDPAYHGAADTAKRLDYAAIARVVRGLQAVVAERVGL